MTIITRSVLYNKSIYKRESEVVCVENILSRYALGKKKLLSGREIIGGILAFLLGRAVMFDVISPFGLSYTAAYVHTNKNKLFKSILVAALGLLGALLADMDVAFVKYMLAYVLFGFIYIAVTTIKEDIGSVIISLLASISIAISGVIFLAQTGFVLYDMMMLGFETAACFVSTLVISGSLPVIYSPDAKTLVHTENLMGFYLMGAVAILGFTDWTIGGIVIGNAFAALFIMIIALAGGATIGAAGGIAVGLIGSLTVFPVTDVIGVYGVCGLVAGLMKKYRRAGVILGFTIANSVLSLYFSGFGGNTFTVFEMVLAVLLFCLVPKSVILEMETLITISNAKNAAAQRSIEVLSGKLKNMSESFHTLAHSFANLVMPKRADNLTDMTVILDTTVDKVCRRCGLKYICWDKEFKETYSYLLKMAPVLYDKNQVEMQEVDPKFSKKCIKCREMVNELNKRYAQYKIDRLWRDQVQEGRELVVNQLYGVSKIMDNVVEDIDKQLVFDTHLENQIYIELEKAGVKCSNITVVKNLSGRYEVSLKIRGCNDKQQCNSVIIPSVSNVLGAAMKRVSGDCGEKKAMGRCVIKLEERESMAVVCAGVKRSKTGEKECGDNYSYEQINNGKYAIILSDGMGCGTVAAKQSCTTIELMQQYLNAGFDKESAASMVNGALFIKPGGECSATIDAAVFDLYASVVDFIKIGANTSYIKHGKHVKKITSGSMPMGILKNVDTEIITKNVRKNDFVILTSDGVHNACEEWLPEFISGLTETDPKEISEKIMEEAVRRKANVIDDDMTVVTAKITERK